MKGAYRILAATFVVAMMAGLRAGLTIVNINPLYTPRELEHQVNDAGFEVIIVFSRPLSFLIRWAFPSLLKGCASIPNGTTLSHSGSFLCFATIQKQWVNVCIRF